MWDLSSYDTKWYTPIQIAHKSGPEFYAMLIMKLNQNDVFFCPEIIDLNTGLSTENTNCFHIQGILQ